MYIPSSTAVRRLTTGVQGIVRQFHCCVNVTECAYTNLDSIGYKTVQHVTVLNNVGNCNKMVSIIIYYNIIISWDHCSKCSPLLTRMSLCGA